MITAFCDSCERGYNADDLMSGLIYEGQDVDLCGGCVQACIDEVLELRHELKQLENKKGARFPGPPKALVTEEA